MNGTKLFTVGYAGRKLTAFVGLLARSGVQVLLDVRELPLSRSKGFSKTPLREALAHSNIEYVHLREAGNPFRHLAADDVDRCLALYRQHLTSHPEVVEGVREKISGKRAVLMCVESEAERCHRSVLVKELKVEAENL